MAVDPPSTIGILEELRIDPAPPAGQGAKRILAQLRQEAIDSRERSREFVRSNSQFEPLVQHPTYARILEMQDALSEWAAQQTAQWEGLTMENLSPEDRSTRCEIATAYWRENENLDYALAKLITRLGLAGSMPSSVEPKVDDEEHHRCELPQILRASVPVSLAYAAKLFKMDPRVLKYWIEQRLLIAKRMTPCRWIFDLAKLEQAYPDVAKALDPNTAPRRHRAKRSDRRDGKKAAGSARCAKK